MERTADDAKPPESLWVKFENGLVDKVKTSGCEDIADFAVKIKEKFSNYLANYDASQLTIYLTQAESEHFKRSHALQLIPKNDEDSPLFVKLPSTSSLAERGNKAPHNASRIAKSGSQGIELSVFHLQRSELLNHAYNILENFQFLVLKSPSGSGKTALLQLFEAKFTTEYECRYVGCYMKGYKLLSTALQSVGIDLEKKTFPETERPLCVMLDDAQCTYSDQESWETLIKVVPMWLPWSVRFIISATHSLESDADSSPASFGPLPKLTRKDFLLTYEEADQMLEDSAIGLPVNVKSVEAKQIIIQQAGGLVGSLSLFVQALQLKFNKSQPSDATVLSYLLSTDILSFMERIFTKNHCRSDALVDEQFKDFLVELFLSRKAFPPRKLNKSDEECFMRLQKAGILSEPANNIIEFTSPLAKRYYMNWLFPHRPSENQFSKVFDLVAKCIESMSASVLRQSVVSGFPKEATFQHLLMQSLILNTSTICSICPELSTIFPDKLGSDGRISGEIDFFINGELRWGIELLIRGDLSAKRVTEHIERFGPSGKYHKFKVSQYAVVDFRPSSNGEPNDDTFRHERLVTVFFDSDFKSCACIFGFLDGVRQIFLQN